MKPPSRITKLRIRQRASKAPLEAPSKPLPSLSRKLPRTLFQVCTVKVWFSASNLDIAQTLISIRAMTDTFQSLMPPISRIIKMILQSLTFSCSHLLLLQALQARHSGLDFAPLLTGFRPLQHLLFLAIASPAGASSGYDDGVGDKTSLRAWTPFLMRFHLLLFSGPTFRNAMPKKKCYLCGKALFLLF